MATLKTYKSKRDFKATPEPSTGKKSNSKLPNFCVQKHAARHLHYDFRLEFQGVLLSWAIPKGPSLNPKDKRLAIKVEDHPLDYQYFEGVIPKGSYGAGTVEIWDKGNFYTPDAKTPKEIENSIKAGLKKGHLTIILEGEKLNGEFNLLKLKQSSDDNAWLFIKKDDSDSIVEKKQVKKKSLKMADFISPMLATLVEGPFDDEDWLFEVKWDGFRALAFINQGNVSLKSRNKLLWNNKFPQVVKDLKKIHGQVILDGELVILDDKGKSHFQLMQDYQKTQEGILCYYVFDILYRDGEDLRSLPLIKRKEILKKILNEVALSIVRYSDHVEKGGIALFKQASKAHLEGIMGKKMDSTYQSRRSPDWVKIKTTLRQEVVIGGFTEPKGSRKKFGALLVGVYNDNEELNYVGHVGGGFNVSLLEEIYKKLIPLIQKTCPFKNEPIPNAPVTWVSPKLICEASFTEWTKDNIMRHPIFEGLRTDKSPKKVKKEITQTLSHTNHVIVKKGLKVELTHLDKIYWPDEKITKGDLLNYYQTMAPYLLPYLKNRPITLHRYPEGIKGTEFYQKDLPGNRPSWIKTCDLSQEGKINHYLLISDVNSLLYAINLGSIDLHPFISKCNDLEKPDYCVIDLDPQGISFDKVIEVALVIHEILDRIKVKHYCKTSGGKGLHIVIPFNADYDYDQSRRFAEIIAHIVNKKLPKTTSLERSPSKRLKRVYLDCLQNRESQTIVAPYAVRPRPGAFVSTPLKWSEVNFQLDPSQYNIKTVPNRIKKVGDIFKPVLKEKNNLKKALDT